jgi:hypothetical protein
MPYVYCASLEVTQFHTDSAFPVHLDITAVSVAWPTDNDESLDSSIVEGFTI